MTLSEIKSAVDSGKLVRWSNDSYKVILGRKGYYLIRCTTNAHCIGLTWTDGKTLNGNESDFYIKGST